MEPSERAKKWYREEGQEDGTVWGRERAYDAGYLAALREVRGVVERNGERHLIYEGIDRRIAELEGR